MLWTIIITVVVVFFILAAIGGATEKKKKEADLARRKAALLAEERQKKAGLLAEEKREKAELLKQIENRKKHISNYADIAAGLQEMSISNLRQFIADFDKRYALIEKYGETEGEKLYNHQYWIGMTEEQIIAVKGQPSKIEIEALKTKTKRVLIYGNKSSGDVFTVVNGKVERFVDR